MTDPPAEYRAIPSSEDQAYDSNVDEAGLGVGGDERVYSTSEQIPTESRTKWSFFLLGCAILLPWNVLLNATPFFLSRLAGSPFYPTFSPYLTSVYTVTKLVVQFYCTFTSKQSSNSRRTFVSIIALLVLATSLCLSTFSRGTPGTFFAFALFNAVSMAVAASYLCTAVCAAAALLGISFLQPVLTGIGASAVAVSVVQVASAIIALWGSSPESVLIEVTIPDGRAGRAEEIAARIMFGVSAIFLCITLVAYLWLARQPFYKSITGVLEQHHTVGNRGDPDERTGLVADHCRNASTVPNSHIYQVFRDNSIFFLSLAYVFMVHISVYPAITARVRPVNPNIHPLLFTAVHFLVMSIGDLLGRCSCSFPILLVWSDKKILAMSLLRTLLIPLILLCNVDRTGTTPIIHSDTAFMIIILTMGYTVGYVSSRALLAVSSLEHNHRLKGRREDVDIAATLGGSCMILGLALGALSSFGVQAML